MKWKAFRTGTLMLLCRKYGDCRCQTKVTSKWQIQLKWHQCLLTLHLYKNMCFYKPMDVEYRNIICNWKNRIVILLSFTLVPHSLWSKHSYLKLSLLNRLQPWIGNIGSNFLSWLLWTWLCSLLTSHFLTSVSDEAAAAVWPFSSSLCTYSPL